MSTRRDFLAQSAAAVVPPNVERLRHDHSAVTPASSGPRSCRIPLANVEVSRITYGCDKWDPGSPSTQPETLDRLLHEPVTLSDKDISTAVRAVNVAHDCGITREPFDPCGERNSSRRCSRRLRESSNRGVFRAAASRWISDGSSVQGHRGKDSQYRARRHRALSQRSHLCANSDPRHRGSCCSNSGRAKGLCATVC